MPEEYALANVLLDDVASEPVDIYSLYGGLLVEMLLYPFGSFCRVKL